MREPECLVQVRADAPQLPPDGRRLGAGRLAVSGCRAGRGQRVPPRPASGGCRTAANAGRWPRCAGAPLVFLCPRSVRGRRPRFALAKTASRSNRLWCGGECTERVPFQPDKRLSRRQTPGARLPRTGGVAGSSHRRRRSEGRRLRCDGAGSTGRGKADRGGHEQSCSSGGRDAALGSRAQCRATRTGPGPACARVLTNEGRDRRGR